MKIIRFWTMMLVASFFIRQALPEDPWTGADLVQAQELASTLKGTTQPEPALIFVGFPVLYHGAHIPGAILAGPAVKPEGIEALKKAVRALPRNREIVLYCGCCPFVKCPNVKPAWIALHGMGFSHVKVLALETNFHTDWVTKGYPVEKG